MKSILTLAVLILSLNVSYSHTEEVILKGNIPYFEFPKLKAQANLIWNFIKISLNLPNSIQPPYIYFSPFNKDKQDKDFTDWQTKWILNNKYIWEEYYRYSNNFDSDFPFPKNFIAFHYDNTNYIQIDPKRSFLLYYQNNPYGVKEDLVGIGFYIMAHEMLHYAFQEKKILPTKNHHCLFIHPLSSHNKSILGVLSDFLIINKLSSPIIKVLGLKKEELLLPCNDIKDISSITKQANSQLKDSLYKF